VFVKAQRPARFAEKLGQLALAPLERHVEHVFAAQLERIEGEQRGRRLGGRPSRRRSNTGMPSSPQMTTSSSIRQDRQESAATAAAIDG
jgi:hypothetical protein